MIAHSTALHPPFITEALHLGESITKCDGHIVESIFRPIFNAHFNENIVLKQLHWYTQIRLGSCKLSLIQWSHSANKTGSILYISCNIPMLSHHRRLQDGRIPESDTVQTSWPIRSANICVYVSTDLYLDNCRCILDPLYL